MKHIYLLFVNLLPACLLLSAQNVGVGTATPEQLLDVNGKIKLADDATMPVAGTIRWNDTTQDFEGYNGTEWLSLTDGRLTDWGGGVQGPGSLKDYSPVTGSFNTSNCHFGAELEISGDWAVIGAQRTDVGGNTQQGMAYIFKREGTTWTQHTALTAGDGQAFDLYGRDVAIDSNYAIVGAPQAQIGANTDRGAAYIYKWNGFTWAFQQKITAPDGQTDDAFAYSVDLQGEYAVLGALGDDVDGNVDEGSAYVFKRVADVWSFEDKVLASDGAASVSFGLSIALDGDRMVVGTWTANAVYVYKRTGSNWSEETKLVQSDPEPGDWFGQSVDISGNRIIVGAWGDNTGPVIDGGSAYLFKYSGLLWEQELKIVPPGLVDGDAFGRTSAIDGDYIIIGSLADVEQSCSTNMDGAGTVWIYKKIGNIWDQHLKISDQQPEVTAYFGWGVAIDGQTVGIGAYSADVGVIGGKVVFGTVH